MKYYVAQQARMGDRHVYGAKSRFMTRPVMACLEPVTWPEDAESAGHLCARDAPQVDVASHLRGLWS
jgi:DNA helicase-2/ATP-dependent DNA helicase PcrA